MGINLVHFRYVPYFVKSTSPLCTIFVLILTRQVKKLHPASIRKTKPASCVHFWTSSHSLVISKLLIRYMLTCTYMSFSFGQRTLQKLHLIEINQFYFSWRENSNYRPKGKFKLVQAWQNYYPKLLLFQKKK